MTERKNSESRYKEAIDMHRKRGIDTYLLECETGETCLLRAPKAVESSEIIPLMIGIGDSKADYLKAGKILVSNCWIAGDEKIRKDEDLMVEVALAALQTIQLKVASIKKN